MTNMKQLIIYICENFMPDYRAIAAQEGFEDVLVKSFPCWCIRNSNPDEFARRAIKASAGRGDGWALICGLHCPLLKTSLVREAWQTLSFPYCQECLASHGQVHEIISGGAYVLSSGWLENWQERLRKAGFDRELARRLYGSGCQELVLLDAGFCSEATQQMESLSAYLDRPGRIISIGPDYATALLERLVQQWRTQDRMQNR